MKKNLIKEIKGREILDSRGNPTIEVEVRTNLGSFFSQVPSGASKGKNEAKELRDGGKRYNGKGVLKAVKNINTVISPKLKGKDPADQEEIDLLLKRIDGTKDKSRIGANALVGVSMAVCRAGAQGIPLYKHIAQLAGNKSKLFLPIPCFNVINGGAHAGNELDIQEFMIAFPKKSYSQSLQAASETYHELKKELKKKGFGTDVGDEGGFAPCFEKPEQALDIIVKINKDAKIVLDCALSQFYKDGKYIMKMGVFKREELLKYYLHLVKKYPILAIEDPFAEEDWKAWESIPSNFLIIGDDLLTTNPERIKMAHKRNACNGLLLKVNQIGTVTEALEAGKLAKSFGWKIMVSHRSGDTCDSFIADLAVGIGSDFIKSGAPARGERVSKYNRLLRIEEDI